MFWIQYKDGVNDAPTSFSLTPSPGDIDYPEQRNYTLMQTQDNGNIVQRPLQDARPRKWIWTGYRPSITPFTSLWTTLEAMEYRTRLLAGKVPTVGVWEDESTVGGFDRVDGGGAKIFTTVKFLRVELVLRKGGQIIYDPAQIVFVLADDTYTNF